MWHLVEVSPTIFNIYLKTTQNYSNGEGKWREKWRESQLNFYIINTKVVQVHAEMRHDKDIQTRSNIELEFYFLSTPDKNHIDTKTPLHVQGREWQKPSPSRPIAMYNLKWIKFNLWWKIRKKVKPIRKSAQCMVLISQWGSTQRCKGRN
jgi:hypothetical protein